MNYRVYVKQAKKNMLPGLVGGDLSGSTGEIRKVSDSQYYSTEQYIPINQNRNYELVYLEGSVNFWVCEYDSNKTYLNGHSFAFQSRTGTDANLGKKYTPVHQDAAYIRIQTMRMIGQIVLKSSLFLFLESSIPVLIHDSNSPKKEYHLLNANLQLSDCAAGSLEFVLHSDHIYYGNKINLWTDTFYVIRSYKDGSERIIWDGRAITEQEDIDGKAYHCEGALSYLNDIRTQKQTSTLNATIYEFLNERIIQKQTDNSIRYNIMDRSFYSHINNDKYVDGSTIICDQGTKYTFSINYESGSKWIDDIKEAFGGHYRVRYRPYDDVTKDVICRCFTYIQDFERSFEIVHADEFIMPNIPKTIPKGIFLYTGQKNNPTIYYAPESFRHEDNRTARHYINDGLLIKYPKKIGRETNEKNIDSTAEVWVISEYVGGLLKTKILRLPEVMRLPTLRAKFGKDIFSAVKTSEIDTFATVIVPRGMQVTSSSGSENDSYIFLSTTGAFVEGKGYINFDTPKDKNKKPIITDALIDEELVKQYGYVMAVVDFEGADTPQALYNQAYDWFSDIKKKLIKQNVEISLSDLGQNVQLSDTSDPLADPEYVDIWTQIYAEIPIFGIDSNNPERYFVSAMSIPLDDYLNTSLTLMNNANLISDNVISAGDIKGSSKGIIDSAS